jgi:starch phosphorylase
MDFSALPQDLAGLGDIAGNLWWSWHPEARALFKMLNRQTWKDSGHNPVKMLGLIRPEEIRSAAGRPEWRRLYEDVTARFRRSLDSGKGWFAAAESDPGHYPLAYFSAEYGLHHSLPFYAGGLGFLAGDHLKEMSDLGVPVVAVGFMYPEGYVLQRILEDGWQRSEDQILDRSAASIAKLPGPDGKPLTVRVPLIEPAIHVAVWKIDVGAAALYLLDTDTDLNDPWHRTISQRLYTGDLEQRLRQEIVLGIGGSGVLAALGIRHAVLHFNEGHAAFALLERVRERVAGGMSFADASDVVRETSVFTMHTPVAAGSDVFPYSLVEKYLHSYWPALGIGREDFFRLGVRPDEADRGFNMTALALRMSGYRNGVSRRHGEVSRAMWHDLWPGVPDDKVPIESITNGVHLPTWVSPRIQLIFDRYLGGDWRDHADDPALWDRVDDIPDGELWAAHYRLKIKLIDAVRELARRRFSRDRVSASLAAAEGAFLDPGVLTIGFARRFATYKRADLVLSDKERLAAILNDAHRPVQIIFGGKAHPSDEPGKRLLQKVFNAARDSDFGGRLAFVEDYGELFAQHMVHGVDVWLNNPLPPMEACGTSGMKAAVNGVPQVSILDGWWAEGFTGRNGWAFGEKSAAAERDPDRDREDAAGLYDVLEREVVPLYYRNAKIGVPHDWVRLMKDTIKASGARFSARRMAKEYVDRFYTRALKKA